MRPRKFRVVGIVVLGLLGSPGLAEDPPPRAPAPLADSAARMTLPPGFKSTLFAGEPDVRQPIALTFDDRGRLWVVECYSYPAWLTKVEVPRDRVLIFEDSDNDGTFDKRTVFWEGGPTLTGIELGFGGVWVCATPNLLFIPDRDGDDRPDGPPEVVLDGWDVKGQHNLFNALIWGPDGWLWGCNGISSNSRVARPGTPDKDRTPLSCAVWRYHPSRKTFEVVSHGTTNPWGLDFDDSGEAFITNCVIPHLYRVIPGAHFERMFGQDLNPFTFGLIGTSADHLHWAGGHWTESRTGARHSDAGGGHAHSGALIYLGDSWPSEYRNNVFMCNIHGNRVNRDVLRREGSGYVASHAKDFLMAHDPWFRGISIKQGPDGSAFVIDWSDTDECHDTDSHGPERQTGRIYKITYGDPKMPLFDLSRATVADLAKLQFGENEWLVRHSRKILQERAVSKEFASSEGARSAGEALSRAASSDPDPRLRLRAIWGLSAMGLATEDLLTKLLDSPMEDVRGWAVRLLAWESRPGAALADRFAGLARGESSPRVRLQLASALQRIGVSDRWGLASALLDHSEDNADPTLPLMLWYGVEAVVPADPGRAVDLAGKSRIRLVRQYVARRVALLGESDPEGWRALNELLSKSDDEALRLDLIRGVGEALKGRKLAPEPADWAATADRLAKSNDLDVKEQAQALSLVFGVPGAVESVRSAMLDPKLPVDRRIRAVQALTERRAPGLAADLRGLLDAADFRAPAIRALSAFDDPETPRAILDRYGRLTDSEKADAVATLASRPAWAGLLLGAIESGKIARRDLSPSVARQLKAIGDSAISAALEKAWGSIRPTAGAKVELIGKYRALLGPEKLQGADPSKGRTVFARACASCHRLYGEGGDVGPELTGSDRGNLDYILENVLDPSATVAREYKLTTVATADGRVLSGIVRDQTDKTLVLQTPTDRVILPKEDVEAIRPSDASMMPEGLFEGLSEGDLRDLIAYLRSKSQVPQAK